MTNQNEKEHSLDDLVKEKPLVTGNEKILVLGAKGQVAGYLVPQLEEYYGKGKGDHLILTDRIPDPAKGIKQLSLIQENEEGRPIVDADDNPILNEEGLRRIIKEQNVKVVINLAALLSGAAQKFPKVAQKVNSEVPQTLLQIARESWQDDAGSPNPKNDGIRLIYTPSSIAVMGGPDVVMPTKAGMDTERHPSGNYGKAKKELEDAFTEYSAWARSLGINSSARCLRYGGVLACNLPPSDGTTEQLDLLTMLAAEFVGKNGKDMSYALSHEDLRGRITVTEDEHGNPKFIYHPQIPADVVFPMLDGRTVGAETLRYLHADSDRIAGHEAHYPMAEYNASLRLVQTVLERQIPAGLKGRFEVVYDESRFNEDKRRFAEREWPHRLDMSRSEEDWGFQAHAALAPSVKHHFSRLKDVFAGHAAGAGETLHVNGFAGHKAATTQIT